MADFEPVEIDFIYGGNTQSEGQKIEQSMKNITEASKSSVAAVQQSGASAVDAVKSQIDKTKENIQNLEKMVSGLKTRMADAAPGNAKQSAILDYNEANRSLTNQKTIFAGLEQRRTSLMNTQKQQVDANKNEEGSILSSVSSLYKWVAGLAAVKYAMELGKKIIESTESTTHQFETITEEASSATGFFFKTLASGDWSNFMDGMERAIQGARDYVNAMEDVQNKTNEQKVKSSSLDIKIGEARADSYSTDPKVVKQALKTIIALQTEKLTEEASLANQNYQVHLKKVADDNNLNKKALENTIKYYTANKETIEMGEKYNELKAIKPSKSISSTGVDYSAISSLNDPTQNQLNELIKEAKGAGIDLNNAAKLAEGFGKVTMPKRTELADLLAKSQDAEAAININNRRDKQRLVGMEKAEEDKAAADAKKAQEEKNKRTKEQLEFTTSIGRERIKRAFEIEQELLNAEVDGTDKERKQADLDYRKKLSEIDIQKAELIKKQNEVSGGIDKKTGKPTSKFNANLSDKDEKQFDDLAVGALKVKDAKIAEITKKDLDALTALYVKYGDERNKIEEEYNARIYTLRLNGMNKEADAVEKEKNERLSKVTTSLIKESDLYKLVSDEKLQVSKATTEKLLEDLRTRIAAEMAAGKLSAEEVNKMWDDINKAQKTVEGDKNKNNPFAQLGSAISGNTAAQKAFKEAPVGTSTEDLAKLEDAANKATASMAGAAGAALGGVQDILQSVVGGLDRLGFLTKEQKKDADNIIGMVGGAANLAMGIAAGNPMQIIQGSIDLIVNGMEYFDFKNKALEKDQKKHLDNVKNLEVAYKKLQRAVETALGTDVYAAQRSEIDNNKKQIAEYEAWIRDERQKKKRKQDADKIAETEAKIAELKASAEDEAKAITEALAQTDAKSLAGELADAITTAFAGGEDAALAFGDVAEKVMQNAVKNALKLQFLEKPMQSAVDQLAKDMESGGALSDAEQAAFRKKIEDAGKVYYDQLAQYSDLFTGEAGKQTGIKGDIKNMTEETGSALTGQVTAMRLNIVALLNNSKSSLDVVGKVLATLNDIKLNTDRLVRMDETLYYLKQNGIKVQ